MAAEKKIFAKVDFHKLVVRLVTALVLLALAYNLAVCWRVFREVPLRESASRSLMAANSGFFYDSGLAEPLPVFALKAAVVLGVDPDAAVRLEGLAAFAAVTLLTLVILCRRFGAIAGKIGALFLATNPYMGYYAMQGDSHLYALFFLLLFWHYFDPAELTLRRAAWAGFFGGLACLSRLDSAWFLLLAVGLFAALNLRKFNFKAAGIALGLAFLLVSPYLVYQRVQYKNSFYAQELRLRSWANRERYWQKLPGPAVTGPLSIQGFIFRDGALGALRGVLRGLGHSVSFELPKIVYFKFIIVLVFLGFYAAFLLKKDALLIFAAAAFLPALALAPIGEIYAAGGITLRYYLWTFWAFCALAGLGFQEILAWVVKQMGDWIKEKETAAAVSGRDAEGGK